MNMFRFFSLVTIVIFSIFAFSPSAEASVITDGTYTISNSQISPMSKLSSDGSYSVSSGGETTAGVSTDGVYEMSAGIPSGSSTRVVSSGGGGSNNNNDDEEELATTTATTTAGVSIVSIFYSNITETTATVMLRVIPASSASIAYGPVGGTSLQANSTSGDVAYHVFSLTGLSPGTTYSVVPSLTVAGAPLLTSVTSSFDTLGQSVMNREVLSVETIIDTSIPLPSTPVPGIINTFNTITMSNSVVPGSVKANDSGAYHVGFGSKSADYESMTDEEKEKYDQVMEFTGNPISSSTEKSYENAGTTKESNSLVLIIGGVLLLASLIWVIIRFKK